MQTRTLGRTGLQVSEIGFGGAPAGIADYLEPWDPAGAVETESLVSAIHRAIDLGLNYFDTAPGYGDGAGEALFGRALAGRRDRAILATKTGARDAEGIRRSVEASLRRLQTEVIDVLQFHGGWYPPEDVERILGEGLAVYQALRDEGKVRFLGFTAEGPSGGVSKLIATGAFDVLQVRYNLLYQHTCDHVNDAGVMREAEARGMGIVTMRTLTSGIFQRLMRQVFPDAMAPAELDRLCLRYVLSNPLVDVAIVGMRRAAEVEMNAALSDDAEARLDLVALHHRQTER
jgi:aryl-alcohol dehydrogenase-like predicted oxidoreductase